MRCPACNHDDSKVVDSRFSESGNSIRRRRECPKCGFRFTTFERLQAANILVKKRSGATEPYDREKLEHGILIACGKRPVSIEKIRESLTELEEKWGKVKEVDSKTIGEDVVEMLRNVDDIAFIRFASVYREFKDVETFKQEFEKLFEKKAK